MPSKSVRSTIMTLAMCAGLASCETSQSVSDDLSESDVRINTVDDVTVHGYLFDAGVSDDAPLILLFHQGGSNIRGEYGPLIPWINENGFRVLAWDTRAGGDRYGSDNLTVAGLAPGVESGFCDAYPDLDAALEYAVEQNLSDEIIVWGSSYTGALVFQLADQHPEDVDAVIAFSPASGDPLEGCRARRFVEGVDVPMRVMRPLSEMGSPSAQSQQSLFESVGVDYVIIENGIHGSSMLVDARTERDMSEARDSVMAWLNELD